jgi:hypothetical protein
MPKEKTSGPDWADEIQHITVDAFVVHILHPNLR